MSRMEPRFEEILEVADADVQKGLANVADEMVAAALAGSSEEIAHKILSNLSERRRAEIVLRQDDFPARTRRVARSVVWKALFGAREEAGESAPPPDQKKHFHKFMEKIAQTHPDFIRAREEGRQGVLAEYFRRLLGK